MPQYACIRDLPSLAGRTITVRGWVMTTRSSGKIGFVVLRDGSGYLQAVLLKNEIPAAEWDRFKALTQETAVAVTGSARAEARAPGGVELAVEAIEILGAKENNLQTIDVRIPIGLMFSIVGLLLTVYGAVTLGEPGSQPTGLPIDLIWGLVLLVFGVGMLVLVRRGRAPAFPGESGASEPPQH